MSKSLENDEYFQDNEDDLENNENINYNVHNINKNFNFNIEEFCIETTVSFREYCEENKANLCDLLTSQQMLTFLEKNKK